MECLSVCGLFGLVYLVAEGNEPAPREIAR